MFPTVHERYNTYQVLSVQKYSLLSLSLSFLLTYLLQYWVPLLTREISLLLRLFHQVFCLYVCGNHKHKALKVAASLFPYGIARQWG